jgi:hypothetical protein
MLILHISVCLYFYEYQRGYESHEDQVGEVPKISSLRQVVPLITLLYLIMFLLITVTCSG